jgi:hypothetical protein
VPFSAAAGWKAGLKDAHENSLRTTGTIHRQEEIDMPDSSNKTSSYSATCAIIFVAALGLSALTILLIIIASDKRDTLEYRDTVKYYELKGDTNAKVTVDKILKELRK